MMGRREDGPSSMTPMSFSNVEGLNEDVPSSMAPMSIGAGKMFADCNGVEAVFVRESGARPEKLIFTKRPIGLSFAKTPPYVVVEAVGHAAELGVEVGWQLCSVGHVKLVGKGAIEASDEKVLKYVHAQTAILPVQDGERKRRSSLVSLSSNS